MEMLGVTPDGLRLPLLPASEKCREELRKELETLGLLGGQALEKVHTQVQRCRACGLCEAAENYVPGEGPADAEGHAGRGSTGAEEDRTGRPFAGASGKILTQLLESAGLRREDVFITSVVKCRPPDNREPTPEEIAACPTTSRSRSR